MPGLNDIRNGKPKLTIGKDGISQGVLEELAGMLKKDGFVKVKAIPSAYGDLDRRSFFSKLAEEGGFKLVEVRGHTAILGK